MYLFVIYALFVNVYNMSGVQQNRRLEVSNLGCCFFLITVQ